MGSRPSRKTFRSRLDEFVNTLRDEIMTGKRAVDEFLPSEKAFAEQYGLSNQSVRKGLDVLVAEGLIVKIARVGNKVAARADGGAVTLKFGYHASIPREAELDQLLSLFHKEYPHIRVQAIPLPVSNYEITKQYMDNEMLDIVTMNYNDFRSFLENDCLNYLEPQRRNPDIYSFLSDAFTVDDRLLVLPFIFSPVILCYNRNHFLVSKMPEPDSNWRWHHLVEVASKLAIANERLGFYYPFLSSNRWPVFLLQRGGAFVRGADGRIRLSGTPMLEAFRFCREMKSYFPFLTESSVNGESEKLLLQGKASMVMTSYFNLNHLRGRDVPFELAPVPHFGEPRTLLMCIGLAVSRYSREKEAAFTLAEFLTSYRAQLMIRQKTFSIPALKPAAEWIGKEAMYRPTRFSLFREIMPSFRFFTDLNIGQTELKAIGEEAKLYWTGLESEDTFCSHIEQLPPVRPLGRTNVVNVHS